MRRLVSQHQKYLAISRILDSNAAVFEGKTEAQAVKDLFTQQLAEASEHISKLLRPISTVRRPKQDVQQLFLDETMRVIGMGIMLATRLSDNPLLDMLKQYGSRIKSIAAYKQYEAALHIIEELDLRPDSLTDIGLTPEKWASYKDLCESFSGLMDETDDKLDYRRLRRMEAKQLIQACTHTVRFQLDPFVKFHKADFPAFHDAYFVTRGIRARHKYVKSEDLSLLVEIMGTVTDGVTGLPIARAVVNVIGLEMAVDTDMDGVYLFEELPAGPMIVACYCQDYELPEQVSMVAQEGESLVVDFVLTPAVGVPVAS